MLPSSVELQRRYTERIRLRVVPLDLDLTQIDRGARARRPALRRELVQGLVGRPQLVLGFEEPDDHDRALVLVDQQLHAASRHSWRLTLGRLEVADHPLDRICVRAGEPGDACVHVSPPSSIFPNLHPRYGAAKWPTPS